MARCEEGRQAVTRSQGLQPASSIDRKRRHDSDDDERASLAETADGAELRVDVAIDCDGGQGGAATSAVPLLRSAMPQWGVPHTSNELVGRAVGRRISVYWDGDDVFYEGTVRQVSADGQHCPSGGECCLSPDSSEHCQGIDRCKHYCPDTAVARAGR